MSTFRAVLTLLFATVLTGCQSLAYYGQAIKGQSAMVLQRQSIPRLLADEKTAPALRQRLESVQRIRAFASSELGLPAARQYDRYVELGRSYPVWSVMAAPELSLTPRQWCYALVGCLNYRGFFSELAAQREGDRLAAQGMDVYVSGVPAYSTLGWFRDPVLSSFAGWPEPELAELIFHELAHQVLFVPGDTVFNESFAVAVADAGLQRYSARYPLDIARLQQARARRAEFVALVMTHRDRLVAQFAAAPTADAKRAIKVAIFADLRTDHDALKQRWGGYAGYDAWFAGLNNARLNAVSNYYELVPLFTRLLEQEGGDFARFFAACRMLARLDYASRRQRLAAMVAAPVEP